MQEKSSNKTADILADDQLQPPLDMVNFTQEQQQSGGYSFRLWYVSLFASTNNYKP